MAKLNHIRKLYKRANKAKKSRLTDETLEYINLHHMIEAEYGMKVMTNNPNDSLGVGKEGRIIGADKDMGEWGYIYVMFLDNDGNVAYTWKHPYEVDYYLPNGKIIRSREIAIDIANIFNDILSEINETKEIEATK